MKKPTFYILIFFVAGVSCTEPYPLDSEANLEELLVVEATITNQLKKQEIKVSRVYELGTEEYAP
ncbi:MAG TPA: DUF4249 domain-containing protein, partial [Salinimicrobium sp.]|nr:DUF4249 domain-containing protein [Salinimicrobium sp.]